MFRLAPVAAMLAIVAGCASAPPSMPPPPVQAADGAQVAAANPNERKQICVREQPVGSAIPVTRCHYEDDGVTRAQNIGAFEDQVHRNTPTTQR